MKPNETITYISIAVIAASLFFIGIEITGNALDDTGRVNVTIDTSASIVFLAPALIDFGNGTISPGETAIVNSSGGKNAYWTGTAPTEGLVLENDGNRNVSFTLMANKTFDDFIGGTDPQFELMVTENELNSCGTAGANITNFTAYSNVTTGQVLACSQFSPGANNSVRIDAQLTMSSDAFGAKTVGVTATATAI